MVIVPVFFGAPWHPLSGKNIRKILEFAEVQTGDRFYDLGSGDGRVLIAAAKHYGADGVGVEIDPIKVWLSRWLIRRAELSERLQIFRNNVYGFDCGKADILYIYLTHQALDRLFPDLLERLKPSVKIVCYRFCIKGIAPVKVSEDKTLFLYQKGKGTKVDGYS